MTLLIWDLTDEDWKSNAAENFAITFALFALFTLALFTLFALTFALTFALFTLALFTYNETLWYYIGRFFGAAYHHYRKKENMPVLEKEE